MKTKQHYGQNRKTIILVVILVLVIALSTAAYIFFRPTSSEISFVSSPQVTQYTTEFPTQSASSSPNGITVDSSGTVWFALWNVSSLAELVPSNGTIHEFPVPGLKAGGMITWGMAVDDVHQRIWLTEYTSNSIWSFDINTHKFAQYMLGTKNSFPFGVALDKNQNVWFTELEGNKIRRDNCGGYPLGDFRAC